MRGTGCSGGAFDYFEELQDLDGYDAIETLAHQTWSNGNVGMVGISYMGISQLFVAQTRPAAPAGHHPAVGHRRHGALDAGPGRHPQHGFAVSWATDRDESAQPEAHQWVKDQIAAEAVDGITTCKDNQQLRLQSVSAVDQINTETYYTAALDALAPRTFVNKIDVPTYIGGAFQDEQTGGEWSSMLKDFAPGTPLKVFMTNGTHAESLAGQDFTHLLEFVDFYVGKRIPNVSPLLLRGRAHGPAGHLRRVRPSPSRRASTPATRPTPRRWPPTRRSPRSVWCGRTAPARRRASRWARPRASSRPGRCRARSPRRCTCSPTASWRAAPELGSRRPAPGLLELRLRPDLEAAVDLRRLDQTTSGRPRPRPAPHPLEPADRRRLARAS